MSLVVHIVHSTPVSLTQSSKISSRSERARRGAVQCCISIDSNWLNGSTWMVFIKHIHIYQYVYIYLYAYIYIYIYIYIYTSILVYFIGHQSYRVYIYILSLYFCIGHQSSLAPFLGYCKRNQPCGLSDHRQDVPASS